MGCCKSQEVIKHDDIQDNSPSTGDRQEKEVKQDHQTYLPNLKDEPKPTEKRRQSGPTSQGNRPSQSDIPSQATADGNQQSLKKPKFLRSSSSGLLENYTIGRVLGEGGFGTVCLVTHKQTQITRAMKMIQKKKMNKQEEERMFTELEILREMDHPHIVKVFEHYQDDKYHYLISEYCSGGELFDRIKDVSPFTEKVAASYMKQIFGAISYCHINKICHRDLKPENILFDSKASNSNLKIIDFGASTKFEPNQKLTKRIGTPFYVAPEILNKQPYDEKCDVWSLGILMYILLCGYPPFWGKTDNEIYEKVKKGKFEFYPEDWDHISEDGKDLIRKLLCYDPNERISTAEAFAHPWIQQNVHVEPLDDKMMRKLAGFNAKNKIQTILLQLIAIQVVNQKEKENLIKNFKAIDKNGDGMLSKEEMILGYTNIFGGDHIKAKDVVERVFGQIDTDSSGKVDFTEFLVASLEKEKMLTREKIEKSFKLIDEDGNGQITKKELEDVMGGFEMDLQQWNNILKECDKNGDGMINHSEFLELLMSSIDKELIKL